MDWKSFDEYAARKRQEALDANQREAEQRARYAEEGNKSLQHLWSIILGGQPSRTYLDAPEAPAGLLSSPPSYIYKRDPMLDSFLNPANALNDTIPMYPRPQWLPAVPGTLDEMPLPMRPDYDRMHKLYAPLFTEEEMPNVAPMPQNGMLQIGSPSTDMPAGGMNPLFAEMQRAEDMKRNIHASQLRQIENSMLPEAQRRREQMLNEQLENIQGVPVEDWLKGLVPGVNGQSVPNPNPPEHPAGNTIRGALDSVLGGMIPSAEAGTESPPRGFNIGYPTPKYMVFNGNGTLAGKYFSLESAQAAAKAIGPLAIIVPIQ